MSTCVTFKSHVYDLSFISGDGWGSVGARVGNKAARPMTTVQDYFNSF